MKDFLSSWQGMLFAAAILLFGALAAFAVPVVFFGCEPINWGCVSDVAGAPKITTEEVTQGFGIVLTDESKEIAPGLKGYVGQDGVASIFYASQKTGYLIIGKYEDGSFKLMVISNDHRFEKSQVCGEKGCGFGVNDGENQVILGFFPQSTTWEFQNFPIAK